jgi:tetratricopeptide (TPR) repeat protein
VILSVQQSRNAPEPQGDFRSSDDSYQSGPLFDMAHGESKNADFVVWSRAQLEEKRSTMTRAIKLLSDQKYDESIADFTSMIVEDPHHRTALVGRAQAYEQSGLLAEAVADYETLIRPPNSDPGFKSRLVDLLSSSPDASVRNGRRAVELAIQVLDATRRNPPNEYAITFALIQLAAAQAESGDFDAAAATQREAIEASTESVRDSLRDRLKLYEARKPYRREMPETGN